MIELKTLDPIDQDRLKLALIDDRSTKKSGVLMIAIGAIGLTLALGLLLFSQLPSEGLILGDYQLPWDENFEFFGACFVGLAALIFGGAARRCSTRFRDVAMGLGFPETELKELKRAVAVSQT